MPGWQFQSERPVLRRRLRRRRPEGPVRLQRQQLGDSVRRHAALVGHRLQRRARYDGTMPGWQMRPGDRHMVGDFDGDGREDLWVFNGTNWAIPYLGMLRSTGSALAMARRYDNKLPGWQMSRGDRHYVGDFDGDGKADLYVFNGDELGDGVSGHVAVARQRLCASSSAMTATCPAGRCAATIGIGSATSTATDRRDLFVYNHQDWRTEYLGTMVSNGSGLSASWRADWVGEWNLGSVDRFEVCNYEGVAGERDLFVHNQDWFGMIRAHAGARPAADLLPMDSQLPVRPELVGATMAKRRTRKATPRGSVRRTARRRSSRTRELPRMGEAPPTDARSRAVMAESRSRTPANETACGRCERPRPERPDSHRREDFAIRSPRRRVEGRRERRRRISATAGSRRARPAHAGRRHRRRGSARAGAELHPGLAYEVTLGSRRVAVGQVQDAGVWRSFRRSVRTARAVGPSHHHPAELRDRRARAAERSFHGCASPREPDGLSLAGRRGRTREGERSIKARLGKRIETIGRLKGIPLQTLPKEAQARVREAFLRR